MKTPEEIQEAHDLLHAVIEFNDTLPKGQGLPQNEAIAMHAAHDALGWTIGCPGCSKVFQKNFGDLRKELHDAGFRMTQYKSHSE